MNYYYQIVLMVLIIINLGIISFLDFRYKIFRKERILDLLFDPTYWIWISIYDYVNDSNKSKASLIIKICFSLIYYYYVFTIISIILNNKLFFILGLAIIVIHLVNYIKIEKYLKSTKNSVNKDFIDYLIPYYIISNSYYLFTKSNGDKRNKVYWYNISRYIFSLNFFYLIYIIYVYYYSCLMVNL